MDFVRSHRSTTVVILALLVLLGCGGKKKDPVAPPGPTAHTVTGTVQRLGAPVEGAFVCLTDRDWRSQSGDVLLEVAITDAGGAFSFDAIPSGDLRLHANSGDTLAATIAFTIGSGAGEVVATTPMALAPACVLYGRASAPSASSDSGITVFAEELLATADTDANGAYRLVGIPVGTWNVDAIVLSPPALARGSASVAAPGDSTHVADLILMPVPIPGPLESRMERARNLAIRRR